MVVEVFVQADGGRKLRKINSKKEKKRTGKKKIGKIKGTSVKK